MIIGTPISLPEQFTPHYSGESKLELLQFSFLLFSVNNGICILTVSLLVSSLIQKTKSHWPLKPYCTDDLSNGLAIRPFETAITKEYIQHNPPCLHSFCVFDLDYSESAFAWEEAGLPPPTWATVNPRNGHCHLAYGLKTPVATSENARQKPLRYLASIEEMMRKKLKADPAYCGLITKNPASKRWKTMCYGTLYELNDLAEHLPGIEKFTGKKPQKHESIGSGRNVNLFDELRYWAYANLINYRYSSDYETWQRECFERANSINCNFSNPMLDPEVYRIAKSVAKWVWRGIKFNIEESNERFKQLQEWRGAKGGKAKGDAFMDKREQAIAMHAQGSSNAAIARELQVHRNSVVNWIQKSAQIAIIR
jgi:hypothetical protein